MNAASFPIHLRNSLSRIVEREDGSSIVELAIVFPILLILFVGTAELGRMFYTYTTLSKATSVGARYLSTSRNYVNGTAQQITDEKTKAQNLVVCGIKSAAATACANQTPVVPGLTTANVLICNNISVACSPAIPAGTTKYLRVEIQNFTYSAGGWNLATMTGKAGSTFYFALKPATETRYMP